MPKVLGHFEVRHDLGELQKVCAPSALSIPSPPSPLSPPSLSSIPPIFSRLHAFVPSLPPSLSYVFPTLIQAIDLAPFPYSCGALALRRPYCSTDVHIHPANADTAVITVPAWSGRALPRRRPASPRWTARPNGYPPHSDRAVDVHEPLHQLLSIAKLCLCFIYLRLSRIQLQATPLLSRAPDNTAILTHLQDAAYPSCVDCLETASLLSATVAGLRQRLSGRAYELLGYSPQIPFLERAPHLHIVVELTASLPARHISFEPPYLRPTTIVPVVDAGHCLFASDLSPSSYPYLLADAGVSRLAVSAASMHNRGEVGLGAGCRP
ncbi:hypothetical protein C8R47DRAFT_1227986 [Mycena vitilis]|nr:hypothetical protein C8R47DRAFT_1227986 [Mycena vitilis]